MTRTRTHLLPLALALALGLPTLSVAATSPCSITDSTTPDGFHRITILGTTAKQIIDIQVDVGLTATRCL